MKLRRTVESKESPPKAFLIELVSETRAAIECPSCRVGTDDRNDIVISGDDSMSRFHFEFSYNENQYRIRDLESKHGTFLNGQLVKEDTPINNGDVLKAGVSLFWFQIED